MLPVALCLWTAFCPNEVAITVWRWLVAMTVWRWLKMTSEVYNECCYNTAVSCHDRLGSSVPTAIQQSAYFKNDHASKTNGQSHITENTGQSLVHQVPYEHGSSQTYCPKISPQGTIRISFFHKSPIRISFVHEVPSEYHSSTKFRPKITH